MDAVVFLPGISVFENGEFVFVGAYPAVMDALATRLRNYTGPAPLHFIVEACGVISQPVNTKETPDA